MKTVAKILVVDDEPAVHKLLKTFLEKQSFEVMGILDPTRVVDEIQKYKPDIVLMDLMMPQLDGISATGRIRNLNLDSYLPIIILTAKTDTKDMTAAMEVGADDYITKPFEFEELYARIRNMLRLKKLHDRLILKTKELNEANQQINRLNHVLVQTNKQLQKKVYDFHNLFDISYQVMGQLEFHKLINQALINILGIFTTRSAMLMLASREDHDVFEVVDAKGFQKSNVQNFNIYRHDKLIHYLELIKKPFQIRDISKEFQDIIPLLKQLEIEVVSPLVQNDEIAGLICLGPNIKDEDYTPENLETLAILTNMLSVAIHNAQLYEHIKGLSYTDAMTGLHNFRFFKLRLKEEIARAWRTNQPISLLILDVDFFKNYNDKLGHPAGDDLLRKLSHLLRYTVRDNDIVCRYGGEEFAIILPGTEEVGAYVLAERLRQKVEKEKFFREEVQPQKKITISIGLSTFPEDAVTMEDLIVAADQALYHAKNQGRNLVVKAKEMEKNQ